MSVSWREQRAQLTFRMGEIPVWRWRPLLRRCERDFVEWITDGGAPVWPVEKLPREVKGYLVRDLPVDGHLPRWRWKDGWIHYVPNQYERFFIDLDGSFDDYQRKFTAKTRSTLRRKVRKFAQRSGGEVKWRAYQEPEDMEEFFRLARAVSAKTYQERLLDSGLPDSEEFRNSLKKLAAEGRAVGFILFLQDAPIAYLYTPERNGALLYQFLGYDPGHSNWSPGTVLQWLVLEWLFDQRRFRFFDFTGGEGAHKRLFGTSSVRCADLYRFKQTPANLFLSLSHLGLEKISDSAVSIFDRLGVKQRIKRWMRRSR